MDIYWEEKAIQLRFLASYSYADKSRRNGGKNLAESFKYEWIAPKLATLHWDSKQMSSLSNRNISEERLTVLVGE